MLYFRKFSNFIFINNKERPTKYHDVIISLRDLSVFYSPNPYNRVLPMDKDKVPITLEDYFKIAMVKRAFKINKKLIRNKNNESEE